MGFFFKKSEKENLERLYEQLADTLKDAANEMNLEKYKMLVKKLENYSDDKAFNKFAIKHSKPKRGINGKFYDVYYKNIFIGTYFPYKDNFRQFLITYWEKEIIYVEKKIKETPPSPKKESSITTIFNRFFIPPEKRDYLSKVIDEWVLVYSYNENLCIDKKNYTIEDFEGTERMIIEFKKEPENEYDKNAVAAYIGEDKVGYIYRGKIQNMVNDWIRRGEKIVAYVKEVNKEGKWVEYRIGFYKLLENFPYKEFTAIKTKQKISEYESREDNVECLIVGEQLIFDSDDEDECVLMNVNYKEVGELPKSAINYINKKDYKEAVAIVSDLEEKLKFKIYKI